MTVNLTKAEIKKVAQEEIMQMLSNTLLAYQESHGLYADDTDPMQKEILKQMDRVAKLLGYDRAWVA